MQNVLSKMKGELINMTRKWDKEKIWVKSGIKPITSQTHGGRSIHWAMRTHGEQRHLTEFICDPSRMQDTCNVDQFTFHISLPTIFNHLSKWKLYVLQSCHGLIMKFTTSQILKLEVEKVAAQRSFLFLWCGSHEGLNEGRKVEV